jgi:gas vesicle protein
MPEVTIKAIGELLESTLSGQLEPIKSQISEIKETVDSHTKDLKEQMIVSSRRADKHETVILLTADKIGVSSEAQKIIHS